VLELFNLGDLAGRNCFRRSATGERKLPLDKFRLKFIEQGVFEIYPQRSEFARREVWKKCVQKINAELRYLLGVSLKSHTWEIDIWSDTEVLVISDANFQDIRPNIIPKHWQLIVLPGANTYDITKVIKQIPANTKPLIVVSAGNHDVMHRSLVLAKDTRDLCDLLKTRKGYAIGLCINENLDPSERNNLDIIDGIYNLTLRNNYIDPGTRHTTYIDLCNVLYPLPTATSIWLKTINKIQSNLCPNITP